MITIIIGMVIGIIIGIEIVRQSYFKLFLEYLLGVVIGGVAGGMLGLGLAAMLPMDTYEKYHSFNIETLQDNNMVSGEFFLGSGKIEDKIKYVFYYEDKGVYRMMQLDYKSVQIKYSEGKPKVTLVQKSPSDALINKFAINEQGLLLLWRL